MCRSSFFFFSDKISFLFFLPRNRSSWVGIDDFCFYRNLTRCYFGVRRLLGGFPHLDRTARDSVIPEQMNDSEKNRHVGVLMNDVNVFAAIKMLPVHLGPFL